eukprot:UN13769
MYKTRDFGNLVIPIGCTKVTIAWVKSKLRSNGDYDDDMNENNDSSRSSSEITSGCLVYSPTVDQNDKKEFSHT